MNYFNMIIGYLLVGIFIVGPMLPLLYMVGHFLINFLKLLKEIGVEIKAEVMIKIEEEKQKLE